MRMTFTTVVCFCIAHGIASVLEICLICRPIAAQWDANVIGLCGNQIASFTALEVSGMVLDLAILLAPLPYLIRSRAELAAKLAVIVLLDAGIL
jgi:hypothetical protein